MDFLNELSYQNIAIIVSIGLASVLIGNTMGWMVQKPFFGLILAVMFCIFLNGLYLNSVFQDLKMKLPETANVFIETIDNELHVGCKTGKNIVTEKVATYESICKVNKKMIFELTNAKLPKF